ncbi:hypothetical protein Tco_1519777, partial [Tanacetum coccineum]
YPPNQKGYRLYDLAKKTLFCSRDVIFKETMFPFKQEIHTSTSPIHHTTPFSTPLYTTGDDVTPDTMSGQDSQHESNTPETNIPEQNTPQFDNEPQIMIDLVPIISDQVPESTSSGTTTENTQVPLRRS